MASGLFFCLTVHVEISAKVASETGKFAESVNHRSAATNLTTTAAAAAAS